MDIHENEEQLGDTAPLPEESQVEEDTAQIDDISTESEEIAAEVSDTLVETAEEADQIDETLAESAEDADLIEETTTENEEILDVVGEPEVSPDPEELEEQISESESELDLPELDEELESVPDQETEETDLEDDSPAPDETIGLAEESETEDVSPDDTSRDPYSAVTALELPEKEPEDGRAWYVVHCYSGNEDKVRHNIMQRIESMTMDDFIFDVVVPTEDEVNIKNGERQTVEKKVFPGYILVNMILTEESWYMVRNTPGVTGFVGMGNDPTPLQPEEVARILKRMESESPRINVTFRAGERVRIVDGPFEDFYGKVAEIDMERATVRVMVNFFGRETPVELDFLQVEQA